MTDLSTTTAEWLLHLLEERIPNGEISLKTSLPTEKVENPLKEYLKGLVSISRAGDESDMWIKYTEKGKMLDEHLLQSGIYGINFVPTTKCVSVTCGQSFYALKNMLAKIKEETSKGSELMSVDVADDIEPWKEREENLSAMMEKMCGEQMSVILIPICHCMHWGMVVVSMVGTNNGKVQWGDSLHGGAPNNLLETVERVVQLT